MSLWGQAPELFNNHIYKEHTTPSMNILETIYLVFKI